MTLDLGRTISLFKKWQYGRASGTTDLGVPRFQNQLKKENLIRIISLFRTDALLLLGT